MRSIRRAIVRRHSLLRPFLRNRYRAYRVAGGLIYLNIKESRMMSARAMGTYEPRKTQALIDLLRPGATFLDIGANKGDFTLLGAKLVGVRGTVLAFEPEPENFRWLGRSIELNGYTNVTPLPIALSDSDGIAHLHLCPTSGGHSLKDGYFDETGTVEVETRTLDGLLEERGIDRVDVIKIDVEGAELGVLEGMRATLERNRDVVLLMDLHPQKGVDPVEIGAILAELGFRAYREKAPYEQPASLDADTRELLARRG